MSKILPQFQSSPDMQAAEAFSEFYFQMQDFKIESKTMNESNEFPPEPSWITAVGAAYFENPDSTGARNIRRQFTMTPMHGHTAEAIGEAYLHDYREHISELHRIADVYQENVSPEVLDIGVLALRASEIAAETGLRTIANFVICSSGSGDQQYSALVIPRKTFHDLPLEHRDLWLMLLKDFENNTGENLLDLMPEVNETARRILQNDPDAQNFSFFAAALNLPRVDIVERAISQYLEHAPRADKYAGMTRKERREAQTKERRQVRKNRPKD